MASVAGVGAEIGLAGEIPSTADDGGDSDNGDEGDPMSACSIT